MENSTHSAFVEQRRAWQGSRTTSRVAGVLLVLLPLVLLGATCKRGIPANIAARLKPVDIQWWGVQSTEEEVAPLIAEYRKLHSHVSVTYRRFRFDEYERHLLDALSERDFRGPDIFEIPSSWSRKYHTKLLPAPKTITMPFQELRGTVKKELYAELRSTRTPSPQELPNLFLDAVIPDAVLATETPEGGVGDPAVFGLPLSLDTLVLYTNRDLLNAAGIPEPARTWTEFQSHVPRLTKVDASGRLIQSGAAIGTSRNVQRAVDLLMLLMAQNGAVISGPGGEPTFHRIPESLSGQRQTAPGEDALVFLTDFANAKKIVFTWDATQPDSLEAFLQGKTAYVVGYSYHLPIIRGRAPRLNLSVSGIPHMAAAVDPATGTVIGSDVTAGTQGIAMNAANLWLQAVSERTSIPNEAWDFILAATTRVPIVRQYLAAAQRPTALRALVGEQLEDPTLKVFAAQLLTARTWYHGRGPEAAEEAIRELIDTVVAGNVDIPRALEIAAQKVAQTL